MKEQNPLEEVRDGIKHVWIHRKGQEAHAAIFDAIEALYGKKELKPVVAKKFKLTDHAWKFHVNLPPGLAYAEFKKKEQVFADALGGTVQIEKRGKLITMEASTCEIKKEYPYSFNPSQYKDLRLPIHFGHSAIGEVVRDLSDMPNLISAGHPGAGKSNFIHTLIMELLTNTLTPTLIVVLDFKRLEYSYLTDHVLLVTEIDQAQAVFQAINKELNKRLDTLEKAGCVKIQEYLDKGNTMPFLVVIVDELAEMQDEECQTHLNRVLRLGRAAGICCVCATQRPSSTMFAKFGDSKAMFAGTMCFHVRDGVNSQMVLDNDRASLIPNIPGRAVYQWDTELEVQTMHLPAKKARKLLQDIPALGVKWYVDESPKRLPPR